MFISQEYPYIEVQFKVGDYINRVQAYIDTGFDGYLVVPMSLLVNFGPEDYVSRWELGDSSYIEAREYLGTVEVSNLGTSYPIRVTVLGDEYLIGRGIVDQLRITFEHGRRIEVES